MATVEVEKLMQGMVFADDAQRAAMEAILTNPTNLETASRRYLRREEGSRLAAETAAAKAEAEREKKFSLDHMAAMEEWQTTREAELKAEAAGEITRFKTELKTKGIDPDSLLGQQMQDRNLQDRGLPPPAPAYDKAAMGKDFLSLETAKVIAQTAIDLPLQMPIIQARVKTLYGDTPVDWAAFQERAKQNIMKGVSLDATAEEIFKLGDKQKEQETAALRAQIEGEYKSKYEEMLAKQNLPGFQAPAYVDPNEAIFTKEFSEHTKVGGGNDDPNFQQAKDDFLRVHAELESAGVPMMR